MTPAALKTPAACRYLGGISRTTLWRRTRKAGIEPNIFGTYNREDLDKLRKGENKV